MTPRSPLETLSLEDNSISDISSLTDLVNLAELELGGNHLDTIVYTEHLASIMANNPWADIVLDSEPLTPDSR